MTGNENSPLNAGVGEDEATLAMAIEARTGAWVRLAMAIGDYAQRLDAARGKWETASVEALERAAARGREIDAMLVEYVHSRGQETGSAELAALPFEEARAVSWKRGRAKYGPEWQGDHPLEEAMAELIDCANYLAEAARRDVHVGDLPAQVEGLWRMIRNRLVEIRSPEATDG